MQVLVVCCTERGGEGVSQAVTWGGKSTPGRGNSMAKAGHGRDGQGGGGVRGGIAGTPLAFPPSEVGLLEGCALM